MRINNGIPTTMTAVRQPNKAAPTYSDTCDAGTSTKISMPTIGMAMKIEQPIPGPHLSIIAPMAILDRAYVTDATDIIRAPIMAKLAASGEPESPSQ